MTEKHFIAIAEILRRAESLDTVRLELADYFKTINSNFNRDQFLQATVPEWRCTRATLYIEPGTPGHADKTARQGHYLRAETWAQAQTGMAARFPEDLRKPPHPKDGTFTADRWESNRDPKPGAQDV